MPRRKKIKLSHIDKSEHFTYLLCDHLVSNKERITREKIRLALPYCELRCEHKCHDFSMMTQEEIDRNLELFIEKYGPKYKKDIDRLNIRKRIYDRCVLCTKDCKREGVGTLIACEYYSGSGKKRISQKMREDAYAIIDKVPPEELVLEPEPDEKPKKKRGRPKGSKNKRKVLEPVKGKTTVPKKSIKEAVKKATKKRRKKTDAKIKKTSTKTKGKKTQTKGKKRVSPKKTINKKASRKQVAKRGKKKTPGLVENVKSETKVGKVKSVRKVRGKRDYWITMTPQNEKFKTGRKFYGHAEMMKEDYDDIIKSKKLWIKAQFKKGKLVDLVFEIK